MPSFETTDFEKIASRHGVRLKKSLGQHILTDTDVVKSTLSHARIQPGDRVLEIGPGLGILTLALAEAGANVVAVETDRSLKPVLEEVLADFLVPSEEKITATQSTGTVKIFWGSAEEIEWSQFLQTYNSLLPETAESGTEEGDQASWKLTANLPYNIATGLILDMLRDAPEISEITVMLQKEVAARLAGTPGQSDYGIPSVKVAYWGEAEVLAEVPPVAFKPEPKVTSALLQIRRQKLAQVDRGDLFLLVEKAFGQRRKMLRKSLQGMITARIYAAAGVDPKARPEELDPATWIRLAQAAPHFDRPKSA